jgi:hypothetical protein
LTEAERLLLLILADAMRNAPGVSFATRQRIAEIRHAMDDEAHAARQSALQGGQGAPRSSGSGETLDAASDAHSPGKGRVP